MNTPTVSGAAPPPAQPRATNFLLRKPLSARRAARIIASFTISATIVAGVLIHFTDRQQFPNIGDGLWWAVQTVTTVGYGDFVPTSVSGRFTAAVVMIGGIGFLTVVTAAITSMFVENTRRQLESSENDAFAAKLDQIGLRLEGIETALQDIRGHGGDAQR